MSHSGHATAGVGHHSHIEPSAVVRQHDTALAADGGKHPPAAFGHSFAEQQQPDQALQQHAEQHEVLIAGGAQHHLTGASQQSPLLQDLTAQLQGLQQVRIG
jgi:hypothetical protein